jgi:hypothetical protein
MPPDQSASYGKGVRKGTAAADSVAMLLGAGDPVVKDGWLDAVFTKTLLAVAIAAELVDSAGPKLAASSRRPSTGPNIHGALIAR